jgi:hypothetical protein
MILGGQGGAVKLEVYLSYPPVAGRVADSNPAEGTG